MRTWFLCGCLLGLAWVAVPRPLTAAPVDPSLCARGEVLQRVVLKALETGDADARDCADITGPQLAALRALGPVSVTHAEDLAGLTGLETLHLRFAGETWPPAFLASTPRLRALTLDAIHLETLPSDFLAPVPHLDQLTLKAYRISALSPDLLAPVPRLTQLALRLELPPPRPPARQPLPSLPPDFLAPVSQLTHLSLECAPPLPPNFLAPVPRLTHLTLCFGYQNQEPLATDFLAPVPLLTHLTLEAFFALPPDFLAPVPRLTHLIEAVPPFPRALQYVPRLTHLEMRWAGQPLASLPYLIQAKLRVVPPAPPLPSDFLAYAPRLEHLEVYAPNVQALPRDFLAHAPRLERLEVYAPRVQALPPSFLAHAPRLIHLDLHDVEVPGLPPDGISPWAPALTTVPDDFLAYAPRLAYLNLPVRRLAQVPSQVQGHLRASGTLAVVDAPLRHVHFPTGSPVLCPHPAFRYPIVDGARGTRFSAAAGIAFTCPEAPVWQPAPQALCLLPAQRFSVSVGPGGTTPMCRAAYFGVSVGPVDNAFSGIVAPVAWVDGLVPLHDQPNRQSAVTGHACRGDVVRIAARHDDGAWLLVHLVEARFFPKEIRYAGQAYWMPATAVRPWLPEVQIPVGCPFFG